jgi:cell filamentation protein
MMTRQSYRYAHDGQDSYCYPGTAVLQNKQGIRAPDALLAAEREITSLKLLLLRTTPLRGRYGFSHLRAIHRFIFGDIYDWAGSIRRGEFMAKGASIFCLGRHIPENAEKVFSALAAENKLRGLSRETFIQRLACYMGEVNALHPFREGNGRAAREFFRQLSKSAGYDLDFGGATPNEILTADIAAFKGDATPLVAILEKAVASIRGAKRR